MSVSRDAYLFVAAKLVGTGDDHAVAGLRAFEDLHRAQAACPGADRPAGSHAVLDDPGMVTAPLFQERPALDHEHVVPGIKQDAGAHPLVLAQSRRLLAVEAEAAGDLAVHHLRRD